MGNIDSSTSFPYTLGDEIEAYNQYKLPWVMYNGIDNNTKDKVTIFSFDKSKHDPLISYARHQIQTLRTLKHPRILRFLNTADTNTHLYFVTERVYPLVLPFLLDELSNEFDSPSDIRELQDRLKENNKKNQSKNATGNATENTINLNIFNTTTTTSTTGIGAGAGAGAGAGNKATTNASVLGGQNIDTSLMPQLSDTSEEATQLMIGYGLMQLAQALSFINTQANIVHSNIQPSSIFIAEDGDWKLSGFELSFQSTTAKEFKSTNNITNTSTTTPTGTMDPTMISPFNNIPIGPIPLANRNVKHLYVCRDFLFPSLYDIYLYYM